MSCWARLTLVLQIIRFKTSAPIDSLAYFFLHSFAMLVYYSDVCVILNPVESISANMCLVPIKRIKDEVIFPSSMMLILSVNFCNVV
jgi:hypothetical protein